MQRAFSWVVKLTNRLPSVSWHSLHNLITPERCIGSLKGSDKLMNGHTGNLLALSVSNTWATATVQEDGNVWISTPAQFGRSYIKGSCPSVVFRIFFSLPIFSFQQINNPNTFHFLSFSFFCLNLYKFCSGCQLWKWVAPQMAWGWLRSTVYPKVFWISNSSKAIVFSVHTICPVPIVIQQSEVVQLPVAALLKCALWPVSDELSWWGELTFWKLGDEYL